MTKTTMNHKTRNQKKNLNRKTKKNHFRDSLNLNRDDDVHDLNPDVMVNSDGQIQVMASPMAD